MRVAEACPRVRWRAYRYSFSLPSLLAAMAFWGGDAGRAMEVEHLHASRGLRRARTPTKRAAALMHALRASLLSCRSGVSSNPPALALQPPFDGYVLSVGYEAGAQRPFSLMVATTSVGSVVRSVRHGASCSASYHVQLLVRRRAWTSSLIGFATLWVPLRWVPLSS
ncbi:hypothetical protein BHE74_00020406 [Ensete ventricosum]|nr:hypothetical protein GW17_00048423 [Ensete ventricosum]RWW71825.1 hypothetical protein BHE74_00020406 [Ensete ventricosum]